MTVKIISIIFKQNELVSDDKAHFISLQTTVYK